MMDHFDRNMAAKLDEDSKIDDPGHWLNVSKAKAKSCQIMTDVDTMKKANYRLGCVLLEEGKLDEAKAHFEKVLELDSQFFAQNVALRMASLLYRQGNCGDAIHNLARVEG